MFTLTIIIILIVSSLNLSYCSPMIRSEIARKRADNLNYKLTESVFPENYTLKISPHFNNSTFTGYVKILIHVKIPTKNITLHQKYLNITKEKIYLTTMDNLVINIKDAGNSGTKEQEFYTITFQKVLNQKMYYLHIPEFYGVLNKANKGFYYAEYKDENGILRKFATTHFESTNARYAFPCFDEPPFRAKFKIYIIRPKNYHSISNTKLMKSIMLSSNLYQDEFELTVSMPTYLVAYIVSEMKLSSNRYNNFHRILAQPEAVQKGYEQHALKHSVKILQALETYLNVNYSLNKMDHAAIPNDFYPAGATENWGLIAYKETGLLLTPRTTTKQHMYVDTVITHEFTHQWFGNLVTIKWWRYLWLKEGFARFLENKIIDKVKPEWRKMEQFIVRVKQEVLITDSSSETRDMNQDVGTPYEIRQLYDTISYNKAACVLHMLETIMTPKIFELGLTNYLQDRAFQSVIPTDLYRNLQKSLDNSTIKLPQSLTIGNIMRTWDSQKGYPLVYVQRRYDTKVYEVQLTQTSYVNTKDFISKPTTWYIPINYASQGNPNFNDTQFSNWLLQPNETFTIPNLEPDDWFILNKQEAYYYRVNYDIRNWKLIAKTLKENYKNIHTLNRAQILDDSFNLAKMDKLDFSVPLQVSSYLHLEDDYITIYVFLRNMNYIAKIIRGTNVEPNFQNYIIQSLKRSYERLGSNPRASDTQIDKLHRIEIVSWMCKFNYSECRKNMWKTFDQWRKYNKLLVVDLEEKIMCNAIRQGNDEDWNYLYEKYEEADNEDFKSHVFESLGCSENVSLLLQFIDSSLRPSIKYTFNTVVKLISKQGLVGFNVSMYYIAEHFNVLLSILDGQGISQILTTITSFLTTESQLDEFTEFLQKDRQIGKDFLMILDKTRLSISRNLEHRQQITKFFQTYIHEKDDYQFRSDGTLCHEIPNTFAFIVYSFIIIAIACL